MVTAATAGAMPEVREIPDVPDPVDLALVEGVFRALGAPTRRTVVERLGPWSSGHPRTPRTALGPGFRPTGHPEEMAFTAVISMEPAGAGTRYRALARHGDAAARKAHEEMGLHDGWGAALDQLVAMAVTM